MDTTNILECKNYVTHGFYISTTENVMHMMSCVYDVHGINKRIDCIDYQFKEITTFSACRHALICNMLLQYTYTNLLLVMTWNECLG